MSNLHVVVSERMADILESFMASYEVSARCPEVDMESTIRASLQDLVRALSLGATTDPVPPSERSQDVDPGRVPLLDPLGAMLGYGAALSRILVASEARDLTVTPREQQVLFSWASAAVAEILALDERRRQRVSSKVAHDLRNPLGSALMALTLLRQRLATADDLRLLDTLERNLRRVDKIVDERLAVTPGPIEDVDQAG